MSTFDKQVKEATRLVKEVEGIEQTFKNIVANHGDQLEDDPMIDSYTSNAERNKIVTIGVDVVKFIREVGDKPGTMVPTNLRGAPKRLLKELLEMPDSSLNNEGGCFLGEGGDVSIADEVGGYSDATEHHIEPVIRDKLVLLRAIQTVFKRELIKRKQSLSISKKKGKKGKDGLTDLAPDISDLITRKLNDIPISDAVSARVDQGKLRKKRKKKSKKRSKKRSKKKSKKSKKGHKRTRHKRTKSTFL
jgi:hypothetical protein